VNIEMKYEGFWRQIVLRFPRYSENRKYIEALQHSNPEMVGQIYDVSVRFGLSAFQVCEALDEEGVWKTNGMLDIELFRMICTKISEINKRDEAAAKRLYYEPISSNEPVTTKRILAVPRQFKGKPADYESLILRFPIRQILENLLDDEHMINVYAHLFDKFEINYKLPNSVIRAMIHFMLLHNRAWSIAYLETIATDLLIKGIKTFDQAMEHFEKRLSWYEKHESGRKPEKLRNQQKPEDRKKRHIQIKKADSAIDDPPLTNEELEELIRRAKEMN